MTVQRSLVIPAFNEAARLATGFERLAPTLEQWHPENTEIVFVDDGSTDGTLAAIATVYGHLPHLKVIQQPFNKGKGAAVRLGWASAKGAHVLTVDADMAIDPRHLPTVDAALSRVAIAAGSRAERGTIRYDGTLRTVAGSLFHRVVTHYTGTTVRDTQCGCKGFQLATARLLGMLGMIEGFGYDAELFYLARQIGAAVETVPVTWQDVHGSTVQARGIRSLLSDLRDIPRRHYENPVIQVARDCSVDVVRAAAVAARQRGLVIARRHDDALIVLPRDGALSAIAIADAIGGTIRTARPIEFVGAALDPV